MRIDEFAQPMDDKLPFDVVDDVAIFMRNDPMFYRKSLFPAIMNMKDRHDSGKSCVAEECLSEVCGRAMESYCSKFKLGSPTNIFKPEDKGQLIQKVFGEEMKMIKDGAY
jgi:hypothetical protein|tara:strand:- start:1865 stop:2194 length:330 start_codon:yes stop_codon:yes gene_type:complete